MRVRGTTKTHAIVSTATLLLLVCDLASLQNLLEGGALSPSPAHRWLGSPTTGRLRHHDTRNSDAQLASRLATLLHETPPPGSWGTHHDAALQLAHAVVWHAQGSVRGGFVRDWILRGERANDVDVDVTRADQSVHTVERSLRVFLAQSPAALTRNASIVAREQLPFAVRLVVHVNGIPEPILVDIQDAFRVLTGKPADADVDNMRVSLARGLHILVNVDGHTVQSAIEHARRKQFVFFDSFDTTGDEARDKKVVRRLRKLLGRGWTCLSTVPASVMDALSETERARVLPRVS